jgi:hypothetical protein
MIGIGMIFFCLSVLAPQELPSPPVVGCNINVLQSFFIYAGVMDIRELQSKFRYKMFYEENVLEMQRRMLDLKDAPPLSDLRQFPSEKHLHTCLEFNREYDRYLDVMLLIHQTRELNDLYKLCKKENDCLYGIYKLASDASSTMFYIHVRRDDLQKLRNELDKIDKSYYDMGILPPPVNILRFNQIK